METRYVLTYTVYAHNLNNPFDSFSPDITVRDFGRNVYDDIYKADKVVYVNPRGTSIILRDKNGEKQCGF